MGSLNKASIIGNLGRDCELRYTAGGTAVATINVATTESWTDKSTGERKEQTEWHRCVLWGKTAESLQEFLVKGKQIYLEGRRSAATASCCSAVATAAASGPAASAKGSQPTTPATAEATAAASSRRPISSRRSTIPTSRSRGFCRS
jgi:hypothetical protein